jgi:hypothetical protein
MGSSNKDDDPRSTNDETYLQWILENAEHDSVDLEKLSTLGSSGILSSNFLFDKPLIEYLSDEEEPKFILSANKAVPDVEDGEYPTLQKKGGKTMHLVTNQRWLVVAANKYSGDQSLEIPLGELNQITYESSSTRHEFKLLTESGRITCPVSGTFDEEEDIMAVAKYINDQINPEDSSEPVLSDEQLDQAKEMTKAAESDSVTYETLVRCGEDYLNIPIIEYISEGEVVKFILTDPDEMQGVGMGKKHNQEVPVGNRPSIYVVTDRRILIPQLGSDDSYSLPYSSIKLGEFKQASLGSRNRLEIWGPDLRDEQDKDSMVETGNEYADRQMMDIMGMGEGGELKYHLWLSQGPDANHTQVKAIQYILGQTIDNPEYVLFTPAQKGTLKILDRDTGEAKMKTKGWNYGLGFIEREKSKSMIEKEGYEAEISGLVVSQEEIVMIADDPDALGDGKQEVRRPFDEIGAIDENQNGFTFYSTTGIYRIEKSLTSVYPVEHERYSSAIEFIRERLHADNPREDQSNEESQGSLDDLEKLADLKEKGVISEEEFETKKAEILENI